MSKPGPSGPIGMVGDRPRGPERRHSGWEGKLKPSRLGGREGTLCQRQFIWRSLEAAWGQHRKTKAVSVVHNKCPFCMLLSKPSLARQGPVSSSEFGRKVASGEPRFNEKDVPSPSHLLLLQTVEAYYSPRSLRWFPDPWGLGVI